MRFVAPEDAAPICRSLHTSATSPTALRKEPVPGTRSSAHGHTGERSVPEEQIMAIFFFLSLLQIAPNRRVQLIKHRRHCPCFFPENWLNKSKARRAEVGEQSWGMSQRGCGARAGHERVWRKGTVILRPPPVETALGVAPGPQHMPKRGVEAPGTRAARAASCGFSSATALIYF